MLFELRTYTLAPLRAQEYLDILSSPDGEMIAPIKQHMIGHFQAEIGRLNQIVSLYRYDSFEQRATVRAEAMRRAASETFAHVPARIKPLLQDMESKILLPTPLSSLR
jgi:hypothetical protein